MTQTKRVNLVGGPFDGTTRVVAYGPSTIEVQLAHPVGPDFKLGDDFDLDAVRHRFHTYQFRRVTDDTIYFVERIQDTT